MFDYRLEISHAHSLTRNPSRPAATLNNFSHDACINAEASLAGEVSIVSKPRQDTKKCQCVFTEVNTTEDSAILFVHALMAIVRDTRIERVSSESGRSAQRRMNVSIR